MNIYLDDNISDRKVAGALRKAGHTVVRPADFGLSGRSDVRHLEYAIRASLVVLTKDSDDFRDLHQLVETSSGAHPGILLVHEDNNPKRDMKAKDIVRAIAKLERSELSLTTPLLVLNHWR
jgi:predicted nuclease of predicted toxin-antitoxin system